MCFRWFFYFNFFSVFFCRLISTPFTLLIGRRSLPSSRVPPLIPLRTCEKSSKLSSSFAFVSITGEEIVLGVVLPYRLSVPSASFSADSSRLFCHLLRKVPIMEDRGAVGGESLTASSLRLLLSFSCSIKPSCFLSLLFCFPSVGKNSRKKGFFFHSWISFFMI